MATNFPGSLDSFTNPTSGSTLDSPSHAGQHANINDAMEAVQAKLGTGAGTIGERVGFTPSWINFTPGNAVESWYYVRINAFVFVYGVTVLGSTSSLAANPVRMAYPIGNSANNSAPLGSWSYLNSGIATFGGMATQAFAGNFTLTVMSADGTYVDIDDGVKNNAPFTWGTNDQIRGSYSYIIA